jgi:hypothetical protein
MKVAKLHAFTIEELVELFATLALEQDKAEFNVPRLNRLFFQIEDIKAELKSRPGDQRRALMRLYGHPNMQVRLKAAKATLALAPAAARAELETIASSDVFPQAGDAGMTIDGLDDGTFKPT